MTRREMLEDMLDKVDHEGGWGEMVFYGEPPYINEFPDIAEAWDEFKKAYNNLYHTVENVEV